MATNVMYCVYGEILVYGRFVAFLRREYEQTS